MDQEQHHHARNLFNSWQENRSEQRQAPPDLFALLLKWGGKFKFVNTDHQKRNLENGSVENKWASLFLLILLLVWGGWGFYTIKEAELGVITRFGRFSYVVQPGLNWKPTFIDRATPVNVELVRELPAVGSMLTQDENVVNVEMNVQYKISDPTRYLFSVVNPDDSLRQATDSALRYVVGHTKMDDVLTRGRAKVRQDTWRLINDIIDAYDMGLQVLDVNFQSARPPEEVKAAFDDAIAAQEDEQRFIREAEAYVRAIEPKARGDARRITEEARAYKERVILEGEGEIARFAQLLPHYSKAPKLTRERLYVETMEKFLQQSRKILLDPSAANTMMVLPLEQLFKGDAASQQLSETPLLPSTPDPIDLPPDQNTLSSELATPVEGSVLHNARMKR